MSWFDGRNRVLLKSAAQSMQEGRLWKIKKYAAALNRQEQARLATEAAQTLNQKEWISRFFAKTRRERQQTDSRLLFSAKGIFIMTEQARIGVAKVFNGLTYIVSIALGIFEGFVVGKIFVFSAGLRYVGTEVTFVFACIGCIIGIFAAFWCDFVFYTTVVRFDEVSLYIKSDLPQLIKGIAELQKTVEKLNSSMQAIQREVELANQQRQAQSAPAPSTNGNQANAASSSADNMSIDVDSNGISEERFVLNGNEYVARWYAGESRGEVCFASNGQSVGMRKAKEIAKEVLTANGDDSSAAAIYTAVKALIASLRRHKQSDSGEAEEAQ